MISVLTRAQQVFHILSRKEEMEEWSAITIAQIFVMLAVLVTTNLLHQGKGKGHSQVRSMKSCSLVREGEGRQFFSGQPPGKVRVSKMGTECRCGQNRDPHAILIPYYKVSIYSHLLQGTLCLLPPPPVGFKPLLLPSSLPPSLKITVYMFVF